MFITFLICSLLSIAPLHNQYNVEDHNENNIVEKLERKNINTDYHDNLYMLNADFTSTEFLYAFINGLYEYGRENNTDWQNIGFGVFSDYTITLTAPSNNGSRLRTLTNGWFDDNVTGYIINKIVLTKDYLSMSSNDNGNYYNFTYRFEMFQNNSHYFDITFNVISYNSVYILPLVYVDYFDDIHNALATGDYIYCENRNDSTYNWSPLLDYYAPNRQEIINQDYYYNLGYSNGLDEGYDIGYEEGAQNPSQTLLDNEFNRGKQEGYAEGLRDGEEQTGVVTTIFNGIVTVGLLPVNVFLQMFNYEIFGINISGLVSGFVTIALILIVVRLVMGNKND